MPSRWPAVLLLALLLIAGRAEAVPRHAFCGDVGASFAFGVSSYGGVRDWAREARQDHGADFRFVYVYILADGMDDPDNFETWYVRPFLDDAEAMGATPVCTFYQLLGLGKLAGIEGASEAAIVAQVLGDADLMRTYFDNFVWLLEIAAGYDPPVVIQVEPDSWGFMMWAMGVEGNGDPTSVPVKVEGSSHPDVSGFDDNAAGLGKALLALRDKYAPNVRMGWHSSNFRVGTAPEVVTSFYGQMGEWDVLFVDGPHVDPDPAAWWDPWDADAVDVNLEWMRKVTAGAGIPLVLWQMPIGTTDFHLIGDPDDLSMLTRFAEAGAVSVLFEHINHNGADDPDDYRASGDFGTIPPADHAQAGGTAACMRQRVAAYSASPLAWPEGSICAGSGGPDAGGQGQDVIPDGGDACAGDGKQGGDCGCAVVGGPGSAAGTGGLLTGLALAALALWRLRG
jgi:hypothetical protein